MKYLSLLIVLFITLTQWSCEDNSVNNGDPNTTDDFPNAQGSTWQYLIIDSLTNTVDTATVTIQGNTTVVSGAQVSIWQWVYPDTVDSNYVLIKQDTVIIYENREALFENIKIKFPLEVGSEWNGDYVTDSFKVTGITDLTVPAGSFSSVYVIERDYGGFNDYKNMTIWFVEDVGIIRISRRDVGLVFQNETRELISYQLP